MGKEILEGCKVLLHTCGAVKPEEKVLVITDDTSKEIGEAMYVCAAEYTDATLICTKDRTTHGEAPTACVAAAMAEADVIFSATTFSLYNTDARIDACQKGARFINMADYSLDMLKQGCLFTDWGSNSENRRRDSKKNCRKRAANYQPCRNRLLDIYRRTSCRCRIWNFCE